MNTFSLKVIACDKVFFDGRCVQVVLPLHDGLKAIQAHHENMVFPVEVGELRIYIKSQVLILTVRTVYQPDHYQLQYPKQQISH